MKELCQPRIHEPVVVTLKEVRKSPIPQRLEGQTDGSFSFDDEINAQQRVCAWCNKVMREGTKPATHGMCSKCLEEQMRSLEEPNSHSRSECRRDILASCQS
jgi:hypothetical protein